MILGEGVVVCLLSSAQRAVIFAMAQLSCFRYGLAGHRPWRVRLKVTVVRRNSITTITFPQGRLTVGQVS